MISLTRFAENDKAINPENGQRRLFLRSSHVFVDRQLVCHTNKQQINVINLLYLYFFLLFSRVIQKIIWTITTSMSYSGFFQITISERDPYECSSILFWLLTNHTH